jgi:hypothetical protein
MPADPACARAARGNGQSRERKSLAAVALGRAFGRLRLGAPLLPRKPLPASARPAFPAGSLRFPVNPFRFPAGSFFPGWPNLLPR